MQARVRFAVDAAGPGNSPHPMFVWTDCAVATNAAAFIQL